MRSATARDSLYLTRDPTGGLGLALVSRGPTLIVLDSAERLSETLQPWLAALCHEAPRVRWLVTSRSRLAGADTVHLPVEGLTEDEGVALFLARSHIQDSAADRQVAANLVALFAGFPLALELAAAPFPLLSPGELLQRWVREHAPPGSAPGLLRDSTRGLRQSSLDATVAWSVGLLSDSDRQTLAHGATFVGGFTLEAAEAVVVGVGDVADRLQALGGGTRCSAAAGAATTPGWPFWTPSATGSAAVHPPTSRHPYVSRCTSHPWWRARRLTSAWCAR